ncbi:MdtA/MuxA family multidrug efflux RND transporter periplasmic adaptor subunit [Xanthomonadaceae bacterium JHOS43]|nr:MdtA/MuxA family multidrug efflux RND transporter periplasmic adaptor subunit [Xanthomonadaceae bacterium JHOS43]MCX7564504.1 MdtA/MuxA family multidrug efflux RND transporter periplasmic adaptor subunit [Xanthomonadaceae bacterium XH05]
MPADTSRSFRRLRPFVWLLGGALVVTAGIIAWQKLGPQPAPTQQQRWRSMGAMAIPVRVAEAVREELDLHLKALGTATALNTVTVRSRVDGELVEIAFEEGQSVAAGDLLARIDPRPYEVRLAQAQGQQAQNLAQLDNARTELARYRDLAAKGHVAAQQLSAQEALVREYEARRQSDQASVDDARLQLSYTRIVAPISGRVGLRNVDVGNLVRAGDAEGLITITQLAPISVLFSVPETELPRLLDAVRADPALAVDAWDRDERQVLARGTLASLDNRIDTQTGTLRLRAQFSNDDARLFPNQFVNVRLRVSREVAVTIPNAAVQYGSNGSYVFVVDAESKVSVRNLVLGASEGERVVVLDGLQAGERVVLEGLDRLREGSAVLVVEDDGATTP